MEPLPAVFRERRRRFLAALPEGGAAILGATPMRQRKGDVHQPHRPDSDFFYLTGFPEPEALALFRPGAKEPYTLFVRPQDPERAHGTSHWLGMDVHDARSYKLAGRSRTLEPGMVLTLEPGLLVTAGGPVVLTEGGPKAPAELLSLLRDRPARSFEAPPVPSFV